LTSFPVIFRFRPGSGKIFFFSLFHHVLGYLRTLYKIWNLVRYRVTRRLTRLHTMCNALKYGKYRYDNS